jgi:hypothetical protein
MNADGRHRHKILAGQTADRLDWQSLAR